MPAFDRPLSTATHQPVTTAAAAAAAAATAAATTAAAPLGSLLNATSSPEPDRMRPAPDAESQPAPTPYSHFAGVLQKPEDVQTAHRKKRKTVRACNHCQRSHLTCNDTRPCNRCVKRGIASSCVDGQRKKAKYLLDAEDQPDTAAPGGDDEDDVEDTSAVAAGPGACGQEIEQQQQQQQRQRLQAMAHMAPSFPQPNHSPGLAPTAAAAATAVAVTGLPVTSAMPVSVMAPVASLATISPVTAAMPTSPIDGIASMAAAATPLGAATHPVSLQPPPVPDQNALAGSVQQQQQPRQMLASSDTIAIPSSLWAAPAQLPSMAQTQAQMQQQQHQASVAHLLQRHEPWGGSRDAAGTGGSAALTKQQSPPPHNTHIPTEDPGSLLSRPSTAGPAVYGLNPVYPQSPAEVYSSVTEPYKYYNGFHYFFQHICGRMDKKNIMRVSRAIAHFRPSLVALLRNLTRDDLIFMEKSFQRALMEYEKLIGFIGTPTVVWRRSGEIALVGKEFSILTLWDRQQLVAGNKFIFELMDTASAVDYWEKFAVHAFENSEHAVMTECRLVRPDAAVVPCAFSFTIKRDLFGIPMAIIGNFLPIL
ncbi:Transcriptional regulator of nonfermentable carbon utilization [Coemansia sp. Benny D115]|nr:Transcriptional regulator of nonfermentable carbon utilization [Coemansia sp. Benny D115]